jgi:DNA-binding response OmpR family regulator
VVGDADPVAAGEAALEALARDPLARAGFRVLTAGDGGAALRLVVAEWRGLAVLDMAPPGLGGAEAHRRARRPSDARVVLPAATAKEVGRMVGLPVRRVADRFGATLRP